MSGAQIRAALAAATLALVGVGACSGEVGGGALSGRGNGNGAPGGNGPSTMNPANPSNPPGAGMGTGMTDPNGARPSPCAAGATDQPGARMLRRLSQAEYNRTVRDALGLDEQSWQDIAFPGELARRGAFANYGDALTVNASFMAALADKTFERAQSLLTGPKAASVLAAPCAVGKIDGPCAEAVAKRLAYRLFRRPVSDAEVATYVALFNQGISELKLAPNDAMAGMLSALLQSPKTMYIGQLGTAAGKVFKLDPYEIASVLSYGLTGTAPTVALLDRVGTGAFSSPQAIATEARLLSESPAGQAHIARFFAAWLQYDHVPFVAKDPKIYPLPPAITAAMVEESRQLVDNTFRNGGGLADLLLSPNTYVNKPLAMFYGWDTAGLTDTQFAERTRPTGQGIGYLAQGGSLTVLGTSDSSSPTQRGAFVLRSLMCRELGSPPPVVPDIIPPTGQITTRQRYEEVHGVAGCAACHKRMDPIGFAFENFDGVGRFRTEEVGKPIDASGSIQDLGGITFNGPEDLARKLAAAPDLAECFAAQLTSYVYGVSVNDGMCIAPAAASNGDPMKRSFKSVLEQVVGAAHATLRAQ